MINETAITALAEQIHQQHHQGNCADIHPILHSQQVKGFYAKAMQETR